MPCPDSQRGPVPSSAAASISPVLSCLALPPKDGCILTPLSMSTSASLSLRRNNASRPPSRPSLSLRRNNASRLPSRTPIARATGTGTSASNSASNAPV
eukprot:scaffold56130_cov47-Phaeocystis_antarctica.AAC.1